jgi:hypothetical protein
MWREKRRERERERKIKTKQREPVNVLETRIYTLANDQEYQRPVFVLAFCPSLSFSFSFSFASCSCSSSLRFCLFFHHQTNHAKNTETPIKKKDVLHANIIRLIEAAKEAFDHY